MDTLDEEYRKAGISPPYNKVAGIMLLAQDSAQHIIGNLIFLYFSLIYCIPYFYSLCLYQVIKIAQYLSTKGLNKFYFIRTCTMYIYSCIANFEIFFYRLD
jgi:hypothetical protein